MRFDKLQRMVSNDQAKNYHLHQDPVGDLSLYNFKHKTSASPLFSQYT
jgi:hypothetical protein